MNSLVANTAELATLLSLLLMAFKTKAFKLSISANGKVMPYLSAKESKVGIDVEITVGKNLKASRAKKINPYTTTTTKTVNTRMANQEFRNILRKQSKAK